MSFLNLRLKNSPVQAGPGLHVGDYFVSENPRVFHGHKLDVFRQDKRLVAASVELKKAYSDEVDISWLPFAAEQYHVSPNIQDYVLVDVPIVVADWPNRNMDAFPYEELTKWRTVSGRAAYMTFVGKPVHQDHQNADDTKAKGVIFDASLITYRGKPHVKILKGFDRTKDPRLAELVQQRNRVGHSMGALVEKTVCSVPWCKYESDGRVTCNHINSGAGKGSLEKGHLIYEKMKDFYFIESSSVEDPAYVIALTDNVF